MERDELCDWLRLHMTPGVGNTLARQLLAAFGLPEQVFRQPASSLGEWASAKQVSALAKAPADLDPLVETTWQWLQQDTVRRRILTLGDPAYPQCLLDMEDPPTLLYGMGSAVAWEHAGLMDGCRRSISVVGSRNPTPQGLENARLFSRSLAQTGLTVVSGMALGVDGAAHEGALEGASASQLASIAVVGTGLDRVYPKQHRDLAHRIADRGVLLSEYSLGTPPLPNNFPKRNRLIAGLSRATLVVEAALKSGSLITARLASEQGKDVFAIPGSIHSTQARGCHSLIKQGAKLVESAMDILEEMNFSIEPESATKSIAGYATDHVAEPHFAPDNALLQAIGFDPTGLDALQSRTGLPTATLQAQLMAMELHGVIARLPGGLFQRVVRV
jgi:DNA processing protein